MTFQNITYNIKSFFLHLLKRSSLTRIQLNDWLANISVKAERVLEVGASSNPVMKKVTSWNVKEYKTLDNNLESKVKPDFRIDLNLLRWSDRHGWTTKNEGETKDIKEVIKYKPNVLFCLEVMEYIYKPDTALKFFYDILSPKGVLYISFHSIYPIHQPYKFDSLRYTKWGITHLLEEVGFSRWDITSRKATEGKDSLSAFYRKEKMKYLIHNKDLFDIGYFIKAIK